MIVDEPEEVPIEYEVFYLWKENKCLLEIFKILRNYLSEYYVIDTAVLIELVKARKLDIEKTLKLIPYIHSGYLSIVIEETPKDGDKDTGD